MGTYPEHLHASEISHKSLSFLSQRKLPPTPINYAVLYQYFSNEQPKLNEALDKQLCDHNHVDDIVLADLHLRFLVKENDIDDKLLSPLEDALEKTLDCVSSHVETEQQTISNLAKTEKVLSELSQHKTLHNIVSFLLKSVEKSQNQRKQLHDKLGQTSDEVSFLRRQLDESRKEAILDPLTGLLNRRGCEFKLETLDIEATHSSMLVDIDHFKQVNDNFGHFIGDKVIQHVARIISKEVGNKDIAVRYGGEEFLVILPEQNSAKAHLVAEKIRTSVEKLKLVQRQSNKQLPTISVSIGLSQSKGAANWDNIFKQADDALYTAKESGRNRCIIANDNLTQAIA